MLNLERMNRIGRRGVKWNWNQDGGLVQGYGSQTHGNNSNNNHLCGDGGLLEHCFDSTVYSMERGVSVFRQKLKPKTDFSTKKSSENGTVTQLCLGL
jgi:hypothetical protein